MFDNDGTIECVLTWLVQFCILSVLASVFTHLCLISSFLRSDRNITWCCDVFFPASAPQPGNMRVCSPWQVHREALPHTDTNRFLSTSALHGNLLRRARINGHHHTCTGRNSRSSPSRSGTQDSYTSLTVLELLYYCTSHNTQDVKCNL